MKKIFVLFLVVLLVVACFSGCKSENQSKDKEYTIDKIGETEYWHNLGKIENLRAGEYPILLPNYYEGKVKSLYPSTLIVSEIYGEPETLEIVSDSVYLTLQISGVSEEPKFIKIK